ncbi:MAG: hypothetical protein SPH92_04880 [Anaerovoracaceae bacterium]|nr:hypothetical protein [Anaerovoracaceae bacterium]
MLKKKLASLGLSAAVATSMMQHHYPFQDLRLVVRMRTHSLQI